MKINKRLLCNTNSFSISSVIAGSYLINKNKLGMKFFQQEPVVIGHSQIYLKSDHTWKLKKLQIISWGAYK